MSAIEKANAATVRWLKARGEHAKALGEVSRLGREMGQAFNDMVDAWALIDGDVARVMEHLRKSAKEPR